VGLDVSCAPCSFIANVQAFVQQFADSILGYLDSQLSDAYSSFQEYVSEGAPLLEVVNTVVQVLDWFPSMSTIVSGIRTAVDAVQSVGSEPRVVLARPGCTSLLLCHYLVECASPAFLDCHHPRWYLLCRLQVISTLELPFNYGFSFLKLARNTVNDVVGDGASVLGALANSTLGDVVGRVAGILAQVWDVGGVVCVGMCMC
jgi:hypothetical protein